MENLILSYNVVFPLFFCILFGWWMRRTGLLDEIITDKGNTLCFKVFLPLHLFNSIISSKLESSFDMRLITFGAGGMLALFIVLMVIVPLIEKENPRRGVIVQAIMRSNLVLFGLPIASEVCGENNLGPTTMLISVIVPLFNALSVIALEWFRGGKPNFRVIVKGIVTNPLIIASVLGLLVNAMSIQLPVSLEKSLTNIGQIATPLALLFLGAGFSVKKTGDVIKQLTIITTARLIVIPLIMVSLGVLFGFRGEYLVPILVLSGAPSGVSSYTMAQQMNGDSVLAGSAVVFTSGISIVTLFFAIFFLKQFGLI